ncbi:MAG TPA: Gfo/Idh/MocA family oxidoreductase [Verrucomicrobia bacterium]|nr:Gfo/Idh/MocA family oxidoreductase [Verrucomicrobiales bacterium]HIL54051.1 Gfo/Idh/MocA family oxidoreductase [Verrucomicrobiota bacterium]
MNVGIVGYGWVAGAHIDALNSIDGIEVTAVYSSRSQDENELSKKHGSSIKAFQDLGGMLSSDDIEVISICSYPDQHKEHAIAAARAGKHLILEKPLALSIEDCSEIRSAVLEANVRTCVCFECRYSSQFLVTKSVIDDGLLGKIHYGEVDYYHGIGPWYGQFRWNTGKEHGGSSLLSAGCHALDALLLCMGGDVEEVSSYASVSGSSTFSDYEYPTTTTTIMKFTDGRVGKATSCIDCLQPYYFHTHLVGSEGSLLDNKFHSEKLSTDKGSWSSLSMKMLDSGDVSDHPYTTQFQAFFDSMAKGEEMPLTSINEAYKSFEVVFAADKSVELGRPVKISEISGD